MVLIFGPLYGGKRDYACALLGCRREELERYARWDVQELAAQSGDLEALADELSRWPVIIATETGGGVVPIDARERAARERAGRLLCLLSLRAERVVRVFYGLPLTLKGGEAESP